MLRRGSKESDGEVSIMMGTTEQSTFLAPPAFNSHTSNLNKSRCDGSNEKKDLVVSIKNSF